MEETQPRGRGAFPFETRRLIHLDGIQKMAFISTIPEEQASADVRKMYDSNREKYGYVPNFAFAFSLRPDVMQAWGGLLKSIRGKMDLRRFELVTVAAARALKSSYCSLAHGSILQRDFFTTDQVESIATDYRNSDLTPAEKAMTAYAEKIVKDASSVSQSDIDTLRSHGFSDTEIFDIAAAAAARCFFSKLLDALGSEPDEVYLELDEKLRRSLTVGRPISGELGE